MLTLVPEPIDAYCEAHSSPMGELLLRLRDETYAAAELPEMQVGPLEGRLLTLLVQLCEARMAVELGTFTGYSALAIAAGLPEDGRLVTCDVDEATTAMARRYWAQSPHGRKIELRLGPALETLRGIPGPVDFAFLDADKVNYLKYWEDLVPKTRPGGLLVCDNTLRGGRVLDPKSEGDRAIVDFNRRVVGDPRVDVVLLPVRDGITVARRK